MINSIINKTKKNIYKYIALFSLIFVIGSTVVFAQSTECTVSDGFFNSITKGLGGGVIPTNSNSGACRLIVSGNATVPTSVQKAALQLNANPNAYVDGGAIGLLAQAAQYSTTASSDSSQAVTFIASKVSPTVNAQSSALQGLAPILVLWGITRNLTYIVLAISLVITGLVLYFGTKSNGKQNNGTAGIMVAEIVATLVFITISFPIGAVIVDLVINLGNAVVASTFSPFINSNTILSNLYTPGSGTNILNMIGDFQNSSVSTSAVNLIRSGLQYLQIPLTKTNEFLQSAIQSQGTDLASQGVNGVASGVFGTLVSIYFGIAQGVAGQVANQPLITAIITFTIFILIFRIVFLLLGSFVGIILTIGFAPFILVSGAFPGTSTFAIFSSWLKRLIALGVVFPVTFALLLLSAIFLNLKQDPSGTAGANCQYQNSNSPEPINIVGTTKGTSSNFFNTTRFDNNDAVTSLAGQTDTNASTRKCFPILLPPKFNWLPAPIGNFGAGFEIDDFTRFVVGLAFLIILPNVAKLVQEALKVKGPAGASLQDALAGAGLLSNFIGQIPVVGRPISQVVSGITSVAK